MRPPRVVPRLILLLLYLHPTLLPANAFVHMPASPESARNSSIELDLLECKTSFDLEKTTLQVLNWQCCVISENYDWKCQSPAGTVVVFSEDKDHKESACYRLATLRADGVRFSFRSTTRAKCIKKTLNPFRSTPRIISWSSSFQLRVQTELVSLVGAADAGEGHLWGALRVLRTLPYYSLRAVQVRGTAAAVAAARALAALAGEDPAWGDAFARLELLAVADAQLGDTLRLPPLPALRELRVERCGLSDIQFRQDPWRLRELHVAGNRLTALPAAAASPALRVLNASANAGLRVSAGALAALPAALARLDLSGVPAVGALLAREPFPALSLVALTLDACGVRAFAPGPAPAPFARLALLQELSLRDNGLTEWPRRGGGDGGGAQHIARLDLSRNALARIPAGSLQASEMLAADNFISQWDADAFSPPVVVNLDLRRNHLTVIRGDMLWALRGQWGLKYLLLQGNPLSCEPCEVRDFAKWLNAQAHLDRQKVHELTCVNGEMRTPLLETSVNCKEATWILELFIPVCAFLLLGGVFYVIWLIWRKELTYMMEIAHLKPIFVWPGYFYRNS